VNRRIPTFRTCRRIGPVLFVIAVLSLFVAACGSDSNESASSSSGGETTSSGDSTTKNESGLPQGKVAKIAAFGITAPETSRWDLGGKAAMEKAAGVLGAEPTWLSNISFDQSPQLLDRLARDGQNVMISNGAGYADAMLAAAEKYPDKWFWVYSALADTKGLPNVVGIDLKWNQIGYLAGAIACMASKSKKVGLVIAQPIPAYTHAAGGVTDGVAKGCGSEKNLVITWTGTFDDNAKSKQAAQAQIAQGADVIIDFQDGASAGVQSAVKANPKVMYVGTMFDWADQVPKQIITSVAINYEDGYVNTAQLLADGKLEPKIYPSSVETGGITLTDFHNVSDKITKDGQALYEGIKSGEEQVDLSREVGK
jgi:basic membrane protein A and related proteins